MCDEVQFSIPEEQEPGSLVGSLKKHFLSPYQLLTQDYLRLDSNTWNLYTTEKRIDREALCPEVTEANGCIILHIAIVGPTEELIKFPVIIEDINDNAPHFESTEIHLRVSEDVTVGANFLLDDLAQDWDIGSNGNIQYHLEGSDGVFDLDVDDGVSIRLVVQAPLDRETQEQYYMTLVAADSGTPSLTSEAALIVTVEDVNDNCPIFSSESPHNVTIPGDSPKNTVVAWVKATDADVGPNAAIVYSLSPKVSEQAKTLFSLDSLTGSITLTQDLQSDILETLVLKVLASSHHCPPADTHVTVSVLPRAIKEPTIKIRFIERQENQALVIPENEPPTVLAVLELEGDRDLKDSSLAIEGEVPFTLNLQNDKYLLSTSKPLDYETKREHQISVVVLSSAGGSVITVSRRVIGVLVTDINDNHPLFLHSRYDLEVEENNQVGMALLQVTASDPDSGDNGRVTYRLGEHTPTIFNIDHNTGQLFVSVSLDREKQRVHHLNVFAQDNGSPPLESMARVFIRVLDQNDNAPVFVSLHFIFFIPENAPALSQVGRVGVTDPDEGENGNTEIHVTNTSGPFVVDNSKRTLRTAASLDRETQARYEFWLVASDHGSPFSLTSSARVTVFIEDINDNQPKVILPNSNLSCLSVSPMTMTGTTVTRIYAVDEDSGLNSQLTYTVIQRSDHFEVDSRTGNITLMQHLRGNDLRMHNLFVVVKDGGEPSPLQTAVWVNLLVSDNLEPCHMDSVPPLPGPPTAPITSESKGCNKESTNLSFGILLLGLGMIIASVCLFLVTVVCYWKKSKRHSQKKTKVYTTENTILMNKRT